MISNEDIVCERLIQNDFCPVSVLISSTFSVGTIVVSVFISSAFSARTLAVGGGSKAWMIVCIFWWIMFDARATIVGVDQGVGSFQCLSIIHFNSRTSLVEG